MITIIFAPPRYGKTALMTYFLNRLAFDKERNNAMQKEVKKLIQGGFTHLSLPKYSVASNYEVVCKQFAYNPRPTNFINPYRLGFFNKKVIPLFLPPCTTIGISEAQTFFNSRKFKFYPDWQSRYYEAHGHNHLDFYLDTQRPMLIDVNVRDLSDFIEVRHLKITDEYLKWDLRYIESSQAFDCYMSSGKLDKKTYTSFEIKATRNVFDFYDTRNLKPRFYDGCYARDFDFLPSGFTPQTLESYMKYNALKSNELPDDFYDNK